MRATGSTACSTDQLFAGGRYNTASGELRNVANEVSVDRVQLGAGWFVTPNILLKGEWVDAEVQRLPDDRHPQRWRVRRVRPRGRRRLLTMRGSSFNGRGAVRAALRRGLLDTAAAMAAVFVLAGAARAQEVRALPGSEVVLRGRTTVGPWRCSIAGASAELRAGDAAATVVRLPLSGVDCGSRGMEADLKSALRADRHANIIVRSLHVTGGADGIATVRATLEVGGVARSISASVRWLAADGRLRLTGALPLRMTDFDVEPPRAMLGLVRVSDAVVVEYDVTVQLPSGATLAALRPLPAALPPLPPARGSRP